MGLQGSRGLGFRAYGSRVWFRICGYPGMRLKGGGWWSLNPNPYPPCSEFRD